MRKDFETKLTKAKEQMFRNSVIKASKILGLPCPPKVKIWDGECPYSDGNEIAHSHPDIGLICISRSRLEAMSMEEIEETAVHETTHMLHIGHDSNFQEAMNDAQVISWVLSHIHDHSKIELKEINNDENVCNYHLCRKKDKLKRCSYCGNYYCKKHIKPRMAITLRQVSTAKEPLRSWLEKEYRRKDGHPDFAYTRIAWQRLEDKEKRMNEKMWETLDRLKEVKKVPPPPIIPKEPRKLPTKIIIGIIVIALIGVFLYNNPQILSDIQNKIENLIIKLPSGERFDVDIKEVYTISECIQEMQFPLYRKYPCLLVELEVQNKADRSTNFILNRYTIVLKNGSQLGIYTMPYLGFINEGEKCYNPLKGIIGEVLFPSGKKTFNLCFPVVDKKDEPKLYVSVVYDFEITEMGEHKGQKKEYSFDLGIIR